MADTWTTTYNSAMEQLSEPDQRLFDEVFAAVRVYRLSFEQLDEALKATLKLLLMAEEQGESGETVIGDAREFARELKSSFDEDRAGRVQRILKQRVLPVIAFMVLFACIVPAIKAFISGEAPSMDVAVLLPALLQAVLVAAVVPFVMDYLRRNVGVKDPLKIKRISRNIAIALASMAVLFILVEIFMPRLVLFNVNVIVLLLVLGAVAAAAYLKPKRAG